VCHDETALGLCDDEEGDEPPGVVMLIGDVLVPGEENVETCRFRRGEEFAVGKLIPTHFARGGD